MRRPAKPERSNGPGPVLIAPSLMCADQLRLGVEATDLATLGMDFLHLDVMDAHYVPNLTFGTDQCRALGALSTIPLDMHLMVDEPDRWAPLFASCGESPYVSIHPETVWHPARTIEVIRDAGGRPGIAVDPAFSPQRFENLFGLVELVLIMTVSPGYAGQKLLPWTLDSIRRTREIRATSGLEFLIEVDGNVSWENIPKMVEAGADVLVAGTSSLFDPALTRPDAAARMRELSVR